jgi:hypothetical protein
VGVVERHFLGFYPGAGKPCPLNCSRLHKPATCVWFEKWFLFFSTRKSHQLGGEDYYDTGIAWNVGTACFDINGCFVGAGVCPELGGCGFTGNLSNLFHYTPPTADEWLAFARKACNRDQYPENGTIQPCPQTAVIYGTRHVALNLTPVTYG